MRTFQVLDIKNLILLSNSEITIFSPQYNNLRFRIYTHVWHSLWFLSSKQSKTFWSDWLKDLQWRCCMHHFQNQSSNQFDAPTCIQQFYLPGRKQINIHLMFLKFNLASVWFPPIPTQSTRRRYVMLLHSQKELESHRHIQNSSLH